MSPQELEIATRLQPSSVGTTRFTPETLSRVFETNVRSQLELFELCNDDMPVAERKSNAKRFMKTRFISRYDQMKQRYILSENEIACLIIFFGADAIDSLFNSRIFEFNQTVQ